VGGGKRERPGLTRLLFPGFYFMTYEQFKTLYELQLTLGACIDYLLKCEYSQRGFTSSVIKEADALGVRLGNVDAHWQKEPPTTTDAYSLYQKNNPPI